MVGIIFIVVGIVAAIIGIGIAFREIEDFLGFFLFSLPGIVSIIIGVILKINHLTMNDETVFGVGIALLGTVFFTISALDIHLENVDYLILMAVPYAFAMISCFMILTGNKPVIDLSDNMVVESISII